MDSEQRSECQPVNRERRNGRESLSSEQQHRRAPRSAEQLKRRQQRNRQKRLKFRAKRREKKNTEAMLESLTHLCISKPSSSGLRFSDAGLHAFAQLHISQTVPVQRSLNASSEFGISPLAQLCNPAFPPREQTTLSVLSATPQTPAPQQPPLPTLPPEPQPPPPPYDPPDDQNGNSEGEAFLNNNNIVNNNNNNDLFYSQDVLAASYEANLNLMRHHVQYYSQYSDMQN